MTSQPRKSCLIVGAGNGLGAALARAFADEGLAVCVTRRSRHLEKLKELAQSIRDAGNEAHAFPLDARAETEIIDLAAKIETDIGPLEVAIFNIGANVWFPVTETTVRVYSKVWEMAALAGPTGLLSEQYGPTTRRALGNFPQCYSHLALIECALRLAGLEQHGASV